MQQISSYIYRQRYAIVKQKAKKNELSKLFILNSLILFVVEYSRLELLTSTLPVS